MTHSFTRDWIMAAFHLVIVFSTIANADDVYLSIGPGGQRMFSDDGLTWSDGVSWGPPKHDQNDLHCGTAFLGVFYVGGGFSQSRLAATRDGKDWSMVNCRAAVARLSDWMLSTTSSL